MGLLEVQQSGRSNSSSRSYQASNRCMNIYEHKELQRKSPRVAGAKEPSVGLDCGAYNDANKPGSDPCGNFAEDKMLG